MPSLKNWAFFLKLCEVSTYFLSVAKTQHLTRQFYHIKFAGVKRNFVNFLLCCKNATLTQVSGHSQTMHCFGARCPILVQLVSTNQPPGLAAPVQNLDEPSHVAPVQK